MPSTDRLAPRPRGGHQARHEPVERGLPALLRVDLHAMIRLLNGQRLTVADVLGTENDHAGGRASR